MTIEIGIDSILAERLKQRDEKALAEVYDRYSPALMGVLLKITQDREAAEDILQEVFLKIWRHSESFDEKKGKLFTWMLNIARNSGIDHLRSASQKNSKKNQSLTISVSRSAGSTIQFTDAIGLKEVLTRLSPEQQKLIDYLYFQGYTQDEVAKETDTPLGTVKTRARAAINALRSILKADER